LFPAIELLAFGDETEARLAVEREQIRGYYVLEKDFLQTGKARLVASKPLSAEARQAFEELLRLNIESGQPAPVLKRLSEGDEVIVRTTDGAREMGEHGWVGFFLPLLTGILFILVINTSGGYLLQAVVEEKENRTMEVIITSVSPFQLMAGKIVGNLSVGLTQLALWGFFAGLGLLVLLVVFASSSLVQAMTQPLLLMFLTLIPSFILVSALMAVAGASAVEAREAQQVAGLFILPVTVPYYFMASILENPNGALAVAFSFFPLSTAVTLPLRAAVTTLPPWQVALNLAVLVLCAAGALWLAGRAFRLGMLRYGKPLSLREILGRQRPQTENEVRK
jgi:ABC-2 type transport system permease protein